MSLDGVPDLQRGRAVDAPSGEAGARKSSPHVVVYLPRPVRVLRAIVAVVVLSKSAAAARLTSKLALVGGVCRATGLALVAEQLVGVAHVGVAPDLGELCAGPLSLGRDLEV